MQETTDTPKGDDIVPLFWVALRGSLLLFGYSDGAEEFLTFNPVVAAGAVRLLRRMARDIEQRMNDAERVRG